MGVDIYANNNCNNVLTKKPLKFFSMGISGGDMSPLWGQGGHVSPGNSLPYAPGYETLH